MVRFTVGRPGSIPLSSNIKKLQRIGFMAFVHDAQHEKDRVEKSR